MTITTDYAAQKLIDEEIQTEIARHETCIKALKMRRNAHCAINQLPDDILSHILLSVKLQSEQGFSPFWMGTRPVWFKILGICHAWSDLVLSSPCFWSTIDLGSPHAPQMLRRSKSAPLRILLRVPYQPSDDFWPLVATVVTQPTRLQVLDVRLPDLTTLSQVLSFIPSDHCTIPILQKLSIQLPYASSTGQCAGHFWSELPSLRSLTLDGVPQTLLTNAQFGPNLGDISIWPSPGSLPSVAWLLGVFQTSQTIKHVNLSALCGPLVDSSFPIISLPALQKMSLRSTDPTTLCVFDKLDMPYLTQIRLSYTSTGSEWPISLSGLWNTLARMLASPTSIDTVMISLDDEFKIVVHLPGAEYETISCCLPSIPQPDIFQLCEVIPLEKTSVLELHSFNGANLGSAFPETIRSATHITTILLSNCDVQILGQLLNSSNVASTPVPKLKCLMFEDTKFCESNGQNNMYGTLMEVVLQREHDRTPIEKIIFTCWDISKDDVDNLEHHAEVDWDGLRVTE